MYIFLTNSIKYYCLFVFSALSDFQQISFIDWFFILPEIYLVFFISLGIIVISMSNFKPLAIFEKKIITKIITNLIILSFYIVSLFYIILIILSLKSLKFSQTYI